MQRYTRASHILVALAWVFASSGLNSTPGLATDPKIVGYYTSWSIYVRDYHVPDIPAEQIGYINYAFANIAGGEIILGDHYADVDRYYPGDSWEPGSLRGCFHQLQILKAAHPHLKTLISVGGWTWSHDFSDVALTPESRSLFASSCVEFIQEYEFDGVDIDWEYPVSGGLPGNIYRPEDRENYTLLLAELRSQLDAAGDYLLTIAAPASPLIMENLEIDAIHPYLDWINVMTYDLHGPWGGDPDPVTGFNAALHVTSDDPFVEPYHSYFNLAAAMQGYLDRGVPAEKLHCGLAFYGRAYGGVPDVDNGLYGTYWGPANDGTWENGVFDYWHLDQSYVDQGGYSRYWHDEAMVPWLYSPNTQIMISYDDSTSIAEKALFARQSGLGGVMFWEFSGDKHGELLGSAHDVLYALPTSVAGGDGPPVAVEPGLALVAWPNPFNPRTTIGFKLDRPERVRLLVLDVAGRQVAVLHDAVLAAGPHSIEWEGRSAAGKDLPSGVYCLRLECDSALVSAKVMLLR